MESQRDAAPVEVKKHSTDLNSTKRKKPKDLQVFPLLVDAVLLVVDPWLQNASG